MATLRIGTFTQSILLFLADKNEYFSASGLDVDEVLVASSPSQFSSLVAHELDLVFTSPDNVLAYQFLPNNPLNAKLDLRIRRVVDGGTGLTLMSRPGLNSLSESASLRVGVDVPTSGFAYVAYALLAAQGIDREEYEVVTLGSTPKRATALLASECDVTILNAGNEIFAREHGAIVHDEVTTLGPYVGTVVAQLRDTDVSELDTRRFLSLLERVITELLSGAHDDLVRQFAQEHLGLSPFGAEAHLAVLKSSRTGFTANTTFVPEAWETLIGLRTRFAPQPELEVAARGLHSLVSSD